MDGEVGFSSTKPSTAFFNGLDVVRGSFGLAVSGAGAVLVLIPSSSLAGAAVVLESSRGNAGLVFGVMGFLLVEPGEPTSVLKGFRSEGEAERILGFVAIDGDLGSIDGDCLGCAMGDVRDGDVIEFSPES